MYESGHEIPPDFSLARAWYRKAYREHHDARAAFNLGLMDEKGEGGPH